MVSRGSVVPATATQPAGPSQITLGQPPAGPANYYALEYYKQLVPNAEVTLPGSTCDTCDPKEITPANTWTLQDWLCSSKSSVAPSGLRTRNPTL